MVRAVFLLLLTATPAVMGLRMNKQSGIPAQRDLAVTGLPAQLKQSQAAVSVTDFASTSEELNVFVFKDYVRKYKRTYVQKTEEWAQREEIFNANVQKVHDQKDQEGQAWKAGINKFTDRTQAEKTKMLGYKPAPKKGKDFSKRTDADGLDHGHKLDLTKEIPESVDWSVEGEDGSDGLQFSGTFIRDQGSCGSCWAVATTNVMEAHLEIASANRQVLTQLGRYSDFTGLALSSQTLVSCVPNLQNCGGSGGCDGATAPLAYDYIVKHGMPWGMDYRYTSGSGDSGTCDNDKVSQASVHMESWVELPGNDMDLMMRALVQAGPLAVSVAANEWFSYSSGVFQPSGTDWDINHAVACFGFGKEEGINGLHYFLIKNSWGADWGEHGFMRLQRAKNVEDVACGMDTTPEHGSACDGDHEPRKVCGGSGILSETSYPVGVHVVQ